MHDAVLLIIHTMSSLVLAAVGPLLSSTAAAIGIVPHVDPNAILTDISEGLLHIKQVLSDIARDARATGCSMQYCQFTLGLVDHRELCEELLECVTSLLVLHRYLTLSSQDVSHLQGLKKRI